MELGQAAVAAEQAVAAATARAKAEARARAQTEEARATTGLPAKTSAISARPQAAAGSSPTGQRSDEGKLRDMLGDDEAGRGGGGRGQGGGGARRDRGDQR